MLKRKLQLLRRLLASRLRKLSNTIGGTAAQAINVLAVLIMELRGMVEQKVDLGLNLIHMLPAAHMIPMRRTSTLMIGATVIAAKYLNNLPSPPKESASRLKAVSTTSRKTERHIKPTLAAAETD